MLGIASSLPPALAPPAPSSPSAPQLAQCLAPARQDSAHLSCPTPTSTLVLVGLVGFQSSWCLVRRAFLQAGTTTSSLDRAWLELFPAKRFRSCCRALGMTKGRGSHQHWRLQSRRKKGGEKDIIHMGVKTWVLRRSAPLFLPPHLIPFSLWKWSQHQACQSPRGILVTWLSFR